MIKYRLPYTLVETVLFFIVKSPSINEGKIIPTNQFWFAAKCPWPTIWEQEVEQESKWEKVFSQTSLAKSLYVAHYVLHQLLIHPEYDFIDILDYAKQSFLECLSIINDWLGRVQPGWVICRPV